MSCRLIDRTYYFGLGKKFPIAGFSRNRNKRIAPALSRGTRKLEEDIMPVIVLWGIPTLIVLAGGGYWLLHMHH